MSHNYKKQKQNEYLWNTQIGVHGKIRAYDSAYEQEYALMKRYMFLVFFKVNLNKTGISDAGHSHSELNGINEILPAKDQ